MIENVIKKKWYKIFLLLVIISLATFIIYEYYFFNKVKYIKLTLIENTNDSNGNKNEYVINIKNRNEIKILLSEMEIKLPIFYSKFITKYKLEIYTDNGTDIYYGTYEYINKICQVQGETYIKKYKLYSNYTLKKYLDIYPYTMDIQGVKQMTIE